MQLKEINKLTQPIIGAAIEVHRHLGSGLLESIYETCLDYELHQIGLKAAAIQGFLKVIGSVIARSGFCPEAICHPARGDCFAQNTARNDITLCLSV